MRRGGDTARRRRRRRRRRREGEDDDDEGEEGFSSLPLLHISARILAHEHLLLNLVRNYCRALQYHSDASVEKELKSFPNSIVPNAGRSSSKKAKAILLSGAFLCIIMLHASEAE